MIRKIQKRAITLLEIMIVIFLIGLIGSVIGINMKGSLDEGKAFKTRQAQEQLRDILLLEVAKDDNLTLEKVAASPKKYLKASEMAKDPKNLLTDGWGENFEIKIKKQDLKIISKRLNKYEEKQNKKRGIEPSSQDDISTDDDY